MRIRLVATALLASTTVLVLPSCKGGRGGPDAVVTPAPSPPPAARASPPPPPGHVGRESCAPCHAVEVALHRGSDHARAMQPAREDTVLGDFSGARFRYAGVTTTFSRGADGAFLVQTDGPEGKLETYPVAYTFGVDPLQQYLVAMPGGKLQALSICWDARPKREGGQRWFHLHPDDTVGFQDVLHWTGPAQNWNHMCAECHSTGVAKNHDPETGAFASTWKELDVSCEACHGPASRHLEWARDAAAGKAPADPAKGLVVDLDPREGVWQFEADAAIARLTRPASASAQIESCGRCHSRRAQIAPDWREDRPLADAYLVSLLDEGLYQADGQILDEVYEYGSFLQSRMHASGVVCSDCHDPHSARLRREGNLTCAHCHRPEVYDQPGHHHHRPESKAALCVSCHMPARTYMGVDVRRDHGFRVPRPDLAAELGTPQACGDCHRERSPKWAADAVRRWFGPERKPGPEWARALAAGRGRGPEAPLLLRRVIEAESTPEIVRATAVALIGRFPSARNRLAVERAIASSNPLVRGAALSALAGFEPDDRLRLGWPLLGDPLRAVRIAAVDALAELRGTATLASESAAAFDLAASEYRKLQLFNSDRAASWVNLGALEARLGNPAAAEAHYRRALTLEPSFLPGYVNLADLQRQQGRDTEGEAVLRDAIARHPEFGQPHHALGLLLVRLGRKPEAIEALRMASTLEPGEPRFVYVYAIGLADLGRRAEAVAALEAAQRRFPADREILSALASFAIEAGEGDASGRWLKALQQLEQ